MSGEPRSAIEGYCLLNDEDAYVKARTLLKERYGNTHIVGNAFRDKLESWPDIRSQDGMGLRKLADFLRQCKVAMNTIETLEHLNDERQHRMILEKLPDWMVSRWNRKVMECRRSNGSILPFEELAEFVAQEADLLCDPVTSVGAVKVAKKPAMVKLNSKKPGNISVRPKSSAAQVFQSSAAPYDTKKKQSIDHRPTFEKQQKISPCPLCKGEHDLDVCKDFMKKPLREREEFIRSGRLCFACFDPNHFSHACKKRKTCQVCSRRHPTSLHDYKVTPAITETNSFAIFSEKCLSSTKIVPVWVSHRDSPSNEIMLYASLDTLSDTTFVTSSAMSSLGLFGKPMTV